MEHLLHKTYIHTIPGIKYGIKMPSENLPSGKEIRQNKMNGSKMELCGCCRDRVTRFRGRRQVSLLRPFKKEKFTTNLMAANNTNVSFYSSVDEKSDWAKLRCPPDYVPFLKP